MASVARMHTVMYGNASPLELASAGWGDQQLAHLLQRPSGRPPVR